MAPGTGEALVTVGTFVRRGRPRWERLEVMLRQLEQHGLVGLSRNFYQELSSLYRSTTGDLVYAQTYFRGTTLLLFLHQLTARAHHQLYRAHPLSWPAIALFFQQAVPQTVREYLSCIIWSGLIFFLGFCLGLSAVQFDERAATVIVPTPILDDIYEGKMWTGPVFSALPSPVVSTMIFTGNISVALFAFIGGLSLGAITLWILFMNGFMLGVIGKLCADHGLLRPLLEFIAAHGFLELSAIIVSGGAGLVLAHALLRPAPYSRWDSLRLHGRAAVRMAIACIPALVAAGMMEAFISPSASIAPPVKVMLGASLGALFWSYLLLSWKKKVTTGPSP